MLNLMDADRLAYAYGILGLVVPEKKKCNLKLFIKYIFRQFNSEDVEGSDDGCSSWYTKLHNYLRVSHPRPPSEKKNHSPFSFKQKSEISGNKLSVCLTVTNFLRISFGETRQLCW